MRQRRSPTLNVLLLTIVRYVSTLPFVPYVTLGVLALLAYLHVSTPLRFIHGAAISASRMLALPPLSPRWLAVGVGSQLLHRGAGLLVHCAAATHRRTAKEEGRKAQSPGTP